jgi:outer membrane lipoprotein-sorting protein
VTAAASAVSIDPARPALEAAVPDDPAASPDGATQTAEAILKRVDANAVAENRIVVAEMTIHGRRESRTIKSKTWVEGAEKSFTEYLAPPREQGTKMLKLGDQLWLYSPSTDRTILISGHMLRQSVMGSDLSYEDIMEDKLLHEIYEAKIAGEEKILDKDCWILDLAAKEADVAYPLRRIWVDEKTYLGLKEERFAKSGRLLKTAEVKSIRVVQGRTVADSAVFKDALKEGSGTEFKIKSIEFDAKIPDYVFSKASLKK